LALCFSAVKLSLGRFPARGGIGVGAGGNRKNGQKYQASKKEVYYWPDCSGMMPHDLPHSLVNTTRPSVPTVR
jgi:hypothetical protein